MPKQRYEPFKQKTPIEERRIMLKKKLDANPNCMVIVLDSLPFSRTCLGKSQLYIVNVNTSTKEIIRNLQAKLKLDMNEVLLIFQGKILLNSMQNLKEIYEKFKDPEDDYLYLRYGLMECVS